MKSLLLLSIVVFFPHINRAQGYTSSLDTVFCILISKGSESHVKKDYDKFREQSASDSTRVELTMILDRDKSYLIVGKDGCKTKNEQKGILHRIREYWSDAQFSKCSDLKGNHNKNRTTIFYD